MSFEAEYSEFIRKHEKKRQGESLRRLKEGHSHAEKLFLENVWWPAFGNFENLHPEYELNDFRDGIRFLDFAFLSDYLRLALEIDGYSSHLQKISRSQFSDQWIRQNHLIIDGWKILRFSYDDVKDRPRMCVQLIQQFMGRWFSQNGKKMGRISPEEKEILRLAIRSNLNLTPNHVCELLAVKHQKARKLLQSLLSKGLLISGGQGQQRIKIYQISKEVSVEELGI